MGRTVHSWSRHAHEVCLVLAGRLQPTGQTETPIHEQSSSLMHVTMKILNLHNTLASKRLETLRTLLKKATGARIQQRP
jgi:hypothetical protein